MGELDFYTVVTKTPIQATLDTVRSIVVYLIVIGVGAGVGAIGMSAYFAESKIEPKIEQGVSKIVDSVKSADPNMVSNVVNSLKQDGIDIVKTVKDVANVIASSGAGAGVGGLPGAGVGSLSGVGGLPSVDGMSSGLGVGVDGMPSVDVTNLNPANATDAVKISGGSKISVKTKGKKTKTNQSEKSKSRKPRTKKCLVKKGNQMFMSFCI